MIRIIETLINTLKIAQKFHPMTGCFEFECGAAHIAVRSVVQSDVIPLSSTNPKK